MVSLNIDGFEFFVKNNEKADFIRDKINSILVLARLLNLHVDTRYLNNRVVVLVVDVLRLSLRFDDKKVLKRVSLTYVNSNGFHKAIQTPHKKIKYILNKAEYLIKISDNLKSG